MTSPQHHSLEASLIRILGDGVGIQILAALSETDLTRIAANTFAHNLCGCATVARNALKLFSTLPISEALAAAHVQHVMWCSWRTAQREVGVLPAPSWDYVGTEFLAETRGKPTVLVLPFTMPFIDVLTAIRDLFADRSVAIYGEGLAASTYATAGNHNVTILGDGLLTTMAAILRTLDNGGVFCTYPDFVYRGHSTLCGSLFGQSRQFSKAFLSVCARPGTYLLPALLSRDVDQLQATFYEPVIIHDMDLLSKENARRLMLKVVIRMLESAILTKPEQWLLLATLSAPACDMLPN